MNVNEDFIYALYEKENKVELIKIPIENKLVDLINELSELCLNQKTSLLNIYSFIISKDKFNLLNYATNYCTSLTKPYQEFVASNKDKLDEIMEQHTKYKKNKNENTKHKFIPISIYKTKIIQDYSLWSKAFAINNAYNVCNDYNNIAYSHRKHGWEQPEYNLTANFSVKLKTNFGFGRPSYFYVIVKYKDIQVTPFSDLITYEYANFSEIINYSKKFQLKNECWENAMIFTKNACNLSLTNENEFIELYIIDECEKMVNGLQSLISNKQIVFKEENSKIKYTYNKSGRNLLSLKGEKISSALNFVTKILEFKDIVKVKGYIKKIEEINKTFYPFLKNEMDIISTELIQLKKEIKLLTPEFEQYKQKKEIWSKKEEIFNDKSFIPKYEGELFNPFNRNHSKKGLFIDNYLEYKEFYSNYNTFMNKYNSLENQIKSLSEFQNKYSIYTKLISIYFLKLNQNIV